MFEFSLLFLCLVLNVGYSYVVFDSSSCGKTKLCVRNVNNCLSTDPTCLIFSYVFDSKTMTFRMEISGGIGGGSQYSAVGISPNGFMERSDVYLCTGSELISGVIRSRGTTPVLQSTLPPEISESVAATTDGVAKCSFVRSANVTKQISDSGTLAFDLISSSYFIIQAFGAFTDGTPIDHDENRWTSSHPINFSVLPTVSPSLPTEIYDPTANCNTPAKGCYFHPSGCKPGSDTCMFASWSYNLSMRTFDFEIVGSRGASGRYAAIAFAESHRMENADLYYCTETRVFSGVLREKHAPPVKLTTNGLTKLKAGVTNGAVTCSFSRRRSISKEISNSKVVNFDLSKKKYFLLYAVGGVGQDGTILRHTHEGRSYSSAAIDFMTSGSERAMTTWNVLGIQGLPLLLMVTWIFT